MGAGVGISVGDVGAGVGTEEGLLGAHHSTFRLVPELTVVLADGLLSVKEVAEAMDAIVVPAIMPLPETYAPTIRPAVETTEIVVVLVKPDVVVTLSAKTLWPVGQTVSAHHENVNGAAVLTDVYTCELMRTDEGLPDTSTTVVPAAIPGPVTTAPMGILAVEVSIML